MRIFILLELQTDASAGRLIVIIIKKIYNDILYIIYDIQY